MYQTVTGALSFLQYTVKYLKIGVNYTSPPEPVLSPFRMEEVIGRYRDRDVRFSILPRKTTVVEEMYYFSFFEGESTIV